MRVMGARSISAAALGLLVVLAIGQAGAVSPSYRVIVNAENGMTTLDRKFLTDAFLKKTTRWPNGAFIRPVDLGADSAVRRRFSEDVLNRSVAAVKSYWQQLIFSGRAIPPPELEAEADIIQYVARYRGAIGYVSANGELAGVRVVSVK